LTVATLIMLPSADARVQQEGGRKLGFLCGNTCPPPAQKRDLYFPGRRVGRRRVHWADFKVALELSNMVVVMVIITDYTQSGIGIYLAYFPS
jgi:hypothetical protein